jgi:aspartyl-tRNA(Asn)/glutamyl-tRNA(Gln) amidotransferase subunit C
MQIDSELILKLEKLAKLKLSAVEAEKLIIDLNKIMHMIDKLQEVDTKGIEPLVHITNELNKMREDIPGDPIEQEKILGIAPDREGHFFRILNVMRDSLKKSI